MLLSTLLGASGCSYLTGGSEVSFSPDSTLAAYVWATQRDLPLPPECPTIRSKVWVRWCRLDKPREYHDSEIGVFGRDWGGWDVKNSVHAAFSPDNRYLAVACPRRLMLIDCETKERRILTGPEEVVTSLIWLDNDQLAYVACSRQTDGPKRPASVSFWRQAVFQSNDHRRPIFSETQAGSCPEKGLGVTGWPRERWSPDGKYVLFRTEGFRGDLKLLDVATGTAAVVAPRGYNFESISWKGDGSAAACVGFSRKAPMTAFVLDPRTGEKIDFSENFMKAFENDSEFSAPPLFRLWTPDDQYLVVNSASRGGCLVKPQPWELIPVAERFIDGLVKDGTHRLAEESSTRLPWVFWLPVKGWLRVWVQFVEPGYRRGMDFLVDYSGRTSAPLAESWAPGGSIFVTPDGKQVVKLESPEKLVIRELKLPGAGEQ